jgi:hypothetical protein
MASTHPVLIEIASAALAQTNQAGNVPANAARALVHTLIAF